MSLNKIDFKKIDFKMLLDIEAQRSLSQCLSFALMVNWKKIKVNIYI